MNEQEQPQAATITNEQTWVEAATCVLADAPAAEPIARLLAESLWPSVAPLVTRAEDAERDARVYQRLLRDAERRADTIRRERDERWINLIGDAIAFQSGEIDRDEFRRRAGRTTDGVLRVLDGQ